MKFYKLRIVLYKSKWFDGHITDNAIGTWTKIVNIFRPVTWFMRSYSHVEIWVPNEIGLFESENLTGEILYWGTFYTSTMRDDVNGVVKRPASRVLKNPERWDIIEFSVSEFLFNRGIAWMNKAVRENKGYSKKLLLRFFLPWIKDPGRFMCSKFVSFALFYFGVRNSKGSPSPLRLASWFKDKIRSLV